jgi:hypothetical protein
MKDVQAPATVSTFRMAQTNLRARPIFHHQRDSIQAHLTSS